MIFLIIFILATIMGFSRFEKGYGKSSIINIYPSGDTTGIADANTLENALNKITPGGTVVLSKGNFYISRSIKIDGFHGTIKGQGKDETFIIAVRSGSDLGHGFMLYEDPIYDAKIPSIIFFYKPIGDIQISDLTAQVNDPHPCDPWKMPWLEKNLTNTICNFFRIAKSDFNTKISNLKMKGNQVTDEYPWFNVLYPYVVEFCESNGCTHIVKNCDFENALWAIEFGEMFGGSMIEFTENIFTDSRGAIQVYTNSNENSMKLVISKNKITQCWIGIILYGVSNAKIIGNKITKCYFKDGTLSGLGIRIHWSNGNSIQDNEIEDCSLNGIKVEEGASYNHIIENRVEDNGEYDLFWDNKGKGNIWRKNKFDKANFDLNDN